MYINHLQPDLKKADNYEKFVKKMSRIPFYEQYGQSCFLKAYANTSSILLGEDKINQTIDLWTEKKYQSFCHEYVMDKKERKDLFEKLKDRYIEKTQTDIKFNKNKKWQKKTYDKILLNYEKRLNKVSKDNNKDNVLANTNYLKQVIFEVQFKGGDATKFIKEFNNLQNDVKAILYHNSNMDLINNESSAETFSSPDLLKKALQEGPVLCSCTNYMAHFDNKKAKKNRNIKYMFYNDNAQIHTTPHSIACFGFVKIGSSNFFMFLDSNNRGKETRNRIHKDKVAKAKDRVPSTIKNILFMREEDMFNGPKEYDNREKTDINDWYKWACEKIIESVIYQMIIFKKTDERLITDKVKDMNFNSPLKLKF